jgi:hypothetical protein
MLVPDFKTGQTEEIIAALIWDVPTLRAGSQSARDFAKALPGALEKWWEPRKYGPDPLGLAAQAVAFERGGEGGRAVPIYQQLTGSDEAWTRLLGLMLLAWSETWDEPHAADIARRAAEQLDASDEVRARLHAKVATFALDAGQADVAEQALQRAVELAPKGSRLYTVLAFEAANAGLGRPDPEAYPDEERPFRQDPLVDYPWIHYAALDAAKSALKSGVERSAERIWTWRLQFGGTTPLDDAVSAEVQATWAGALWLRRGIRLQVGAQLLDGEAAHPRQWGYGVLMWALGGGKDPDRVFHAAEPHLDQESVDFVVRNLHDASWPRSGLYRFISVASGAWDSMSDATLRWAIDLIEPQAGEHPTVQEVHRLWAGYAARFPEEWSRRVGAFPREVQMALVSMLGLPTVETLPPEGKDIVRRLALDAVREHERPDAHQIRLAAALAPPDTREELKHLVEERALPEVIARLAETDLVSPTAVERARTSLISSIERQSVEAKEGKMSFGRGDERLALARLVAVSASDPRAVEVLTTVATDHDLPGDHILAARNGLALLRHEGKLPDAEVARWHETDDPAGTLAEHGAVTSELARIRRLQILALALTPAEVVEVITATRSPDRRVRLLATDICGEAGGAAQNHSIRDPFVWALIGALFDPLDEVVASAVRGLAPGLVVSESIGAQVALDRFPRLYEIGNQAVREAVVETVARLGPNAPGGVKALVRRAASDKSWRVRQAAQATDDTAT